MSTEENITSEDLSLGQLFKQQRVRKDLHIENISRETRISRSILQSLEADHIDDLPKKIYVIGFVKTYARLLDLDEDQCLKKLESLYNGEAKFEEDEDESVVLKGQREGASYSNKLLLIVPLIVISIILIIIVRSNRKQAPSNMQVQKQVEESNTTLSTELTVKEVMEKKIEPRPTVASEVEKVEPTAPAKNEVVKAEAVQKIKEEKKETETKQTEEDKKVEIKFNPMPYPLYSVVKDASEEQMSKLPQSIKDQYNKELQNVYLYAEGGDSWLTYQKNQGEIYKYVIKDGKELFIQSEQIKMFIGNIHITKIFLNNELLKVPSRSGVKSIVFPQSAAKDLVIPLFIFNKENGSVQSSEEYLEKQAAQESEGN